MAGTGRDGEKVTNLEYLLRLAKGNDQFVKDMVRIFLEENPGEVGTLEEAIRNRDFQLINAAAHKLRSTVPFVGIDRLISEEISEIESLAKEKAGDPMAAGEPAAPARSILPDNELIGRIEKLFDRIRKTCFAAYEELRGFRTA